MATAIVWDDDPAVEPEPPTPKQTLLNPDPKLSSEAYRAMYLGTVDTGELVAELAKRGYDAHPRITYGSVQYCTQLMQNVATLGSSSAITSSAPEPKVSTWKALLGRDK